MKIFYKRKMLTRERIVCPYCCNSDNILELNHPINSINGKITVCSYYCFNCSKKWIDKEFEF